MVKNLMHIVRKSDGIFKFRTLLVSFPSLGKNVAICNMVTTVAYPGEDLHSSLKLFSKNYNEKLSVKTNSFFAYFINDMLKLFIFAI